MRWRWACLAAMLLVGSGVEVSGQRVEGRLIEAGTSAPVAGALVVLIDSTDAQIARSLSAGDGAFAVDAPAGGWYRLRSSRIGYTTATTEEFEIRRTETLQVQLRLDQDAIPLEPLTVTGRASQRRTRLELSGFNERMRLGQGYFMEREDIENSNARNMAEMLRRAPGVQVVGDPRGTGYTVRIQRGGSCLPAVYMDGLYIGEGAEELYNHLANDVDAVEVYTSPIRVPPAYRGRRGACGAVIIWTRER